MSGATDRQIDYLLSLASQVQGRTLGYLSQVTCISLTQRETRGGMTRAEASAHISELKDLLNKGQQ